jgi:ribosomal protein S18 acetylase RimI-like enzyme
MNMSATITLRSIQADDEQFLCRVYRSTREAELAQVAWSNEQKEAFVQMQFMAQHQYYQEQYTDTTWDIILVDDQPAGRLYVARWLHEMRIVDIALLPDYRNAGIGSMLLRALQAEAEQANKMLSIHVEQFNPAQHLYERLGFHRVADKGVYWLMEWKPSLGTTK